MRKGKKGAALILTLFTLVIVSVFISLIFLISKNEINIFSSSRKESKYTQYIKETLDIIISPVLLGNGDLCATNHEDTFRRNSFGGYMDEFITVFKQELNTQRTPPYNNYISGNYVNGYPPEATIFQDNNSGIDLTIIRDPGDNNSPISFSVIIYRRESPGSNIWVVNHSYVRSIYTRYNDRSRSDNTVLPSTKYSVDINTIVLQANTNTIQINDFFEFVRQNSDRIIWQGRGRATIVQRSPYGAVQNAAMFVKFSGLWVPFGANPFSQDLINQGIDSCVGITVGYHILGEVVTPRAQRTENYMQAFDNSNNRTTKSGITTIWSGTPSLPIIRGRATTGYASIDPNNLQQFNPNQGEYSIRTHIFSTVTGGAVTSHIEGRIPGEGTNQVVDFNSLPQRRKVTIRVDSNRAVLVGEDRNTGQIITRSEGGGLIEIQWPMRGGRFVSVNNLFPPNSGLSDAEKKYMVLDQYPPGYANVYIVPEGNRLRIFAVGKYSGRKVPADELLQAIQLPQEVPKTIFERNREGDLVVNLNNLTQEQRSVLSMIHVEGGNVILMPNSQGNTELYYQINQQNNQQNNRIPFDLTIVSTRLGNTDAWNNRNFYKENNNDHNQHIDRNLGGWIIPVRRDQNGREQNPNDFVPNGFTINLGDNGIRYALPGNDPQRHDRRRQIVRALEGNVIIQDFHDRIGQGRIHMRDNQESLGYIGFKTIDNQPNMDRFQRVGGRFTIISHNFVILNYQVNDNDQQRRNQRGQTIRARLAADIVTYRGNLQIIDADMYRFLLDTGRQKSGEANEFLQNIVTNDKLYWYGKYVSNFASVEGVMLPDQRTIRGFSETSMQASDYNYYLPRATRKDFRVRINGRYVILFDIEKFEINK